MELIYAFSVDNPIIVLVMALILTIHHASGCPAPPNLKNSTNSNNSQNINNKVKGSIIFVKLSSIIINN